MQEIGECTLVSGPILRCGAGTAHCRLEPRRQRAVASDPSAFAWKYMRLPVDTEDDGRQYVSVTRYLSKKKYLASQHRRA